MVMELTKKNLDEVAEVLEDENYELGPQDRELLLFMVRLYQHGLEEVEGEEVLQSVREATPAG